MTPPMGSAKENQDPFRPPAVITPSGTSRRWIWLLVGGVLVSICLCSGMCIVPTGVGVYFALAERDDVEAELNGFLQAADAGRFEEARDYFSTRARSAGGATREQVETLAKSDYGRGCQAVHVTNINVSKSYNSDKSVPQGTVATVSGTTDYQDGASGTFRATLEKEEAKWRLHDLRLERPLPPRPAESPFEPPSSPPAP